MCVVPSTQTSHTPSWLIETAFCGPVDLVLCWLCFLLAHVLWPGILAHLILFACTALVVHPLVHCFFSPGYFKVLCHIIWNKPELILCVHSKYTLLLHRLNCIITVILCDILHIFMIVGSDFTEWPIYHIWFYNWKSWCL